jgi:hypothetical protein
MGGGLMQLVAYGAQDIYLTGNPQITFFKVVYRRHTNFSMEAIAQTFNGTVGYGNRVTATISRNGDLVHRMYLEIECTTESSVGSMAQANFGSAIIQDCEVEIGGQKIDKQTGLWMETWAELTEPNPTGHAALQTTATGTGNSGTLFQNMSMMGGVGGVNAMTAIPPITVPLQFWFCRNPGLALPLIALQYHEVKVVLNISTAAQAHGTSAANRTTGPSMELFCDYIYLDTDERRRFAQVSHEYLIEQVQYESKTGGTMDLNFNHPVKELIWVGTPSTSAEEDEGISTPVAVGTTTYQLKLNGHDRFSARKFRYFTRTQIWQHHSGAGGIIPLGAAGPACNDSIAVYSFALKPEEHQPSGTCNFSRIDNAQLIGDSTDITVFAVNYNVLRIMSGMGGLAYSN